MTLLFHIAMAASPTLGAPQLVESHAMKPLDFDSYRAYADKLEAMMGPGFPSDLPGAVGYGFNCGMPSGKGNMTWALLLDEGRPILVVDANKNGKVQRRERLELTAATEGFALRRIHRGLDWQWRAFQQEGTWRVACDLDRKRAGAVELADQSLRLEVWSQRRGEVTSLVADMDGNGELTQDTFADEEVYFEDGVARFQALGRKVRATIQGDTVDIEDLGEAPTELARLRLGEPMPLLQGPPGLVVFMRPNCGWCEKLAPELVDTGARTYFNGTDDDASTWTETYGVPLEGGPEVMKAFEALAIQAIPCAATIDEDGTITALASGYYEVHDLLKK